MSVQPRLAGGPLSESDYQSLDGRWISKQCADAALLRRVVSVDGAEIVGKSGRAGDYSGIVIPYIWPGEASVRLERIRRDHPDREQGHDGKLRERGKYMGPPGCGNILYIPPGVAEWYLHDSRMPIVIVEGEFKTLALWRLAWHGLGESAESPAFLPVGLQGVWNWRGTVGKTNDEHGSRVNVKGVIADMARILWEGRRVVIVFDKNVGTNMDVAYARKSLTNELMERHVGEVAWFGWPAELEAEINGIDDLLAARGPEPVIKLFAKAKVIRDKAKRKPTAAEAVAPGWGAKLLEGDRGPKPLLANVMIALRWSEEFKDALAYDEFSVRTVATRGTIWDAEPCDWTDFHDAKLADWMQHQRIDVSPAVCTQAVEVVARDRAFHPVREYLRRQEWDGERRLDEMMIRYFGAKDDAGGYARAVGAKWMISAVARVMEPGCQADHCLIFQGLQGLGKSTALRTLAGDDWFNDDVEDLGSKDSAMQIHGKWIIELGELDAVVSARSEMSRVKAFITRRIDHFRPPYGRRTADFPRQCVFAGSINKEEYLRDETGARRFWPVKCTKADVRGLARDRDQLWAEARSRYEAGEPWWLDSPELTSAAEAEQEKRFEVDPWEQLVWDYMEGARAAWLQGGNPLEAFGVGVEEILEKGIKKKAEAWTRFDRTRVVAIMRMRGFELKQVRQFDSDGKPVLGPNGKQLRPYRFEWPEAAAAIAGK